MDHVNEPADRTTTVATSPVRHATTTSATTVTGTHGAGIDVDNVKRVSAAVRHAWSRQATTHAMLLNHQRADAITSRPHLSTALVLDQPFLIWELPHPRPGFDPHYEPGNSSMTMSVLQQSPPGDRTQCIFYFLWNNASAFAAVIDVSTSIVLDGLIQIIGAGGILNPDSTSVSLTSELDIYRWSGWGPDPVTGAATDETLLPFSQATQFHTESTMTVTGGHLDSSERTQRFPAAATDLGAHLIAVPAGAVTMFEVVVTAQWALTGDGGPNRVDIDFGSPAFHRRIVCPSLTLGILTPTGAATLPAETASATVSTTLS